MKIALRITNDHGTPFEGEYEVKREELSRTLRELAITATEFFSQGVDREYDTAEAGVYDLPGPAEHGRR